MIRSVSRSRRKTTISFDRIKELVGEEKDTEFFDVVSDFTGVIISLSSFVFGPPVLGLLGPKSELFKAVKRVYKRLASNESGNYADRQRRMEIAYGLLPYTAFFEVWEEKRPEIWRLLELQEEEDLPLGRRFKPPTVDDPPPVAEVDRNAKPRSSVRLPHPAETFAEQLRHMQSLFQDLARGVLGLLQNLNGRGAAGADAEVRHHINQLPQLAERRFRDQYVELASRYQDFYVWSNLHEHEGTRENLNSLASYVAQVSESLDEGFMGLLQALRDLPKAAGDEVLRALARTYEAELEKPIIVEQSSPGRAELSYPTKSEIFVPQAYRALVYRSQLINLGAKRIWDNIEPRDDLGAFLMSFLTSPYSTETPLLILGNPGSGKSLLTEILAARLSSQHRFRTVRVKLRDVDPEADIQTQIEQAVRHDTGLDVNWVTISKSLGDNVPIIILDGYDELLQATGKVFSNYLIQVTHFQEREAIQGRPVRVIVTSRITLVDKTHLPEGCTILRLEQFDEQRRQLWITSWNESNHAYFDRTAVERFQLPSDDKIVALARQPLLLLMLAIYDSDDNGLHREKIPDRMVLYNSLLTRFIEREQLRRDPNFGDLDAAEREAQIEREMQRLGVVALGMHNRRTLHAHPADLIDDLEFFDLEREMPPTPGSYQLSQAELLFGGFFFLLQDKAGTGKANEKTPEAYEFIHNTFGEFLTADFILRRLLYETERVQDVRTTRHADNDLHMMLDTLDGLPSAWFACLIYTPLYSKPMVLEMLRGWMGHLLQKSDRDEQKFVKDFDEIMSRNLRALLLRHKHPEIMLAPKESPFPTLPLLTYLAIYSLNLVILRTVFADGDFEFSEDQIGTSDSLARPWDQLTHLWRSRLPFEDLKKLSAILEARRAGSRIRLKLKDLKPKETFGPTTTGTLEDVLGVSLALADGVTAGLAGSCAYEGPGISPMSLEEIESCLSGEDIDLGPQLLLQKLRQAALRRDKKLLGELVEEAAGAIAEQTDRYPLTTLEVLRMVRRAGLDVLLREPTFDNVLTWLRNALLSPLAEPYPHLLPEMLWLLVSDETGIFSPLLEQVLLPFLEHVLADRGPFDPASPRHRLTLEILRLIARHGDVGLARRYLTSWMRRIDLVRLLAEVPTMTGEVLRLTRECGVSSVMDAHAPALAAGIDIGLLCERDPASAVELLQFLHRSGDLSPTFTLPSSFLSGPSFQRLVVYRYDLVVDLLELAVVTKDVALRGQCLGAIFDQLRLNPHGSGVLTTLCKLIGLMQRMGEDVFGWDILQEIRMLISARTPDGRQGHNNVQILTPEQIASLSLHAVPQIYWLATKLQDPLLLESITQHVQALQPSR